MFDLDPEKLLVLGILALVVLGPTRLPEAARSLGRIVGQLKAMSSSFQTEVRDALGEPGEALTSAVTGLNSLRPNDVRGRVRRAVTTTLTTGPDGATQANGTAQANGSAAAANGAAVEAVTAFDGVAPGGLGRAVPPGTPDDPSLN